MADEVVRRLTISATSTGIDDQTAKLKKLSDASNNVAQVTDTNAKRALSAEAAYAKLTNQIDDTARAQQAIEKGTKTLNAALAQGVITQDQYNESLRLLNDKYKDIEESSEGVTNNFHLTGLETANVTNHLGKAAAAAYALSPAFRAVANPAIAAGLGVTGQALALMGPVAAGIAVSIVSRLMPALGLVLRVAGPILLVVDAIKLVGYAWDSASAQIEKYNNLSKESASSGVSTDFLQRQAKGFEAVGLKIDDATASLKKFSEISQSKLGGSDLDKKLNAHLEVGNVSKGGLLSIQNAEGVEGKYRALTALLTKMADEGKKLAALDIGATFMSPSTLEGFRRSNDYLTNIQQNADKIAATKLISQEDINDAVQLQNRYDAAVKILGERWIPFQETITAGGMLMQRVWVSILETLASALTTITNFAVKIGELIGSVPRLGKAIAEAAANTATFGLYGMGKAAVGALGGGGEAAPADPMSIARAKLANGLSNSTNRTAWAEQGTGIADRFRPDSSKSLEKEAKGVEEYADAIDRAIASITKHIEIQKADAASIGLGVEAHARLKVGAQQTAAIQANGGKITAQQTEEFRKLAIAAGDAALSLEKAKVNSDISRDRQLAFASPEDVSIANQLRGLYGDDIPAALSSSEAAAIRMNNRMKEIGDTARSAASAFANDFVSGIMSGKSAMESLSAAASSLGKSLTKSGIDNIIKDPLNPVGWVQTGIGVITSWFTGNSEKKKKEEEARQKAIADAAAKAAAIQDRKDNFTTQYQLSTIDTGTIAGQLQAFDISANRQRAEEMKAGGEAIVELEKLLAAQREDIVKKANAAVLKQYNDFLNSIKTGSLSTLSPEDQLKFAQSRFDKSVAGAKNGDEDSIARVTQDAQSLLEIAKAFYASSTGYTSTYDAVTAAVQGLASGSQYKGYASGGFVTNGTNGVDSVMAKLAGGEHVTKTSSVNSATRGALQYINSTGKAPGDSNLARILVEGFNGQTSAIVDAIDGLSTRVQRLEATTRQGQTQRRVPGSERAA